MIVRSDLDIEHFANSIDHVVGDVAYLGNTVGQAIGDRSNHVPHAPHRTLEWVH